MTTTEEELRALVADCQRVLEKFDGVLHEHSPEWRIARALLTRLSASPAASPASEPRGCPTPGACSCPGYERLRETTSVAPNLGPCPRCGITWPDCVGCEWPSCPLPKDNAQ